MTPEPAKQETLSRGCVYFNFGTTYALQLLVSIHSLRKHYSGPITVFLLEDEHSDALKHDIEALGASADIMSGLSRSNDRHRILAESPYATTLSLDADIIFTGPIDALWEPLEREGVLVTRFFPPPFGIGGTPQARGPLSRVKHMEDIRSLLEPERYELALHRLVHDRIDVNIGVLGLSRPKGDAFLQDWSEHMERGRESNIPLLDELLVIGLLAGHPHHLADEIWNCPADEIFRRTNLSDAVVIHYFADGKILSGVQRMGRNAGTWAGRQWYQEYREAAAGRDLSRWRRLDKYFDPRAEPYLANGAGFALRRFFRQAERSLRRMRKWILGKPSPRTY